MTKAQMIVKQRIDIFASLAGEYRKKAKGMDDWRYGMVMEFDAVARELRDILKVLEVGNA